MSIDVVRHQELEHLAALVLLHKIPRDDRAASNHKGKVNESVGHIACLKCERVGCCHDKI